MNLENFKQCVQDLDQVKLRDLESIVKEYKKIIILGNGGSNAISGHIAQDYTKVLNKKAICFCDSARLTCYANDYGWNEAYSVFLEHFADKQTLVILISSSGNSKNICNAAGYCKFKHIPMITLSGFNKDNTLKTTYSESSLLHFWVDSTDYGIVECLHHVILHSVI